MYRVLLFTRGMGIDVFRFFSPLISDICADQGKFESNGRASNFAFSSKITLSNEHKTRPECGEQPRRHVECDSYRQQGTKVCRYNWHSASFLGWPFPVLKYKYIFQIKYTEAILSSSTRKLSWFEITGMLIAV